MLLLLSQVSRTPCRFKAALEHAETDAPADVVLEDNKAERRVKAIEPEHTYPTQTKMSNTRSSSLRLSLDRSQSRL